MTNSTEKFDKLFCVRILNVKRRWLPNNNVALCLLSILTLCASESATTNDGICGSQIIKYNQLDLLRLRNCRVIEGSLKIFSLRWDNETDYEDLTIPELVEITDFLLLYNIEGLKSLAHLFPNLQVIRGNNLITNYALVIYRIAELTDIGLMSLTTIGRGAVRIERNPSLCFANTIHCPYIANGTQMEDHFIDSIKNSDECGVCPVASISGADLECRTEKGNPTKRYCWSQQHCQKISVYQIYSPRLQHRPIIFKKMATFKKLQVTAVSSDFRKATSVFEQPIPKPGPGQILVKNHFCGVNAADINVSSARYFTDGKVPFDIGFESLGEVEAVGKNVANFKVGQAVVSLSGAGYSEYLVREEKELFPLPELNPKYISLMLCGLSAAIGLDVAGKIKAGDKVLITAPAGGTGHLAVQWAKSKGAHVIGTTSSAEKVSFVKSIGADHVINYNDEDLSSALKRDYPDGVDVIWETIGGGLTETLSQHLAKNGRMLIIGAITGYKTVGFPKIEIQPGQCVMKDITLTGFLFLNHVDKFSVYLKQLIEAVDSGKFKVTNDFGESTPDGVFKGLDGVVRGVEHLHSGKSIGKVTIKIR